MRKHLLLLAGFCLVASTTWAQPFGYSVNSNGTDNLYMIDLATGIATDMGVIGLNDAEGLAFANGSLYAIGGTVAELWDVTTTPGTLVGPTGPRGGSDAGLSFDVTSGTMYNVQGAGGLTELHSIDLSTGAATFIGSNTLFSDGLAIDATGVAYGTDFIFADSLYSIDLTNATAIAVGPLNLGNVSLQSGLAFDQTGTLWSITSDGNYYTIDPTTGTATLMGSIVDSATGAAIIGWEGLAIELCTPGGPVACPTGQYETNDATLSTDINGLPSSSFRPISYTGSVGEVINFNLGGMPLGYEAFFNPLMPIPDTGLLPVTKVNIDVFTSIPIWRSVNPALSFNAALNPVPAAVSFPVTLANQRTTLQTFALDPTSLDGFAGSAAVTYIGLPCTMASSFDPAFPSDWQNGVGGTASWSVNSGGTTSGATGPTAAATGANYLYCETSSPNSSGTFQFQTCPIDVGTLANFQLDYQVSAIGATIGTLVVEVSYDSGATFSQIDTLTGAIPGQTQGGIEWEARTTNLGLLTGVTVIVRFTYSAGGGFTGDLAIDDIVIS